MLISGTVSLLKDVPDPKVKNQNAAIDALRKLKQLAMEHDLITLEAKTKGDQKKHLAAQKDRIFIWGSDEVKSLVDGSRRNSEIGNGAEGRSRTRTKFREKGWLIWRITKREHSGIVGPTRKRRHWAAVNDSTVDEELLTSKLNEHMVRPLTHS